MNKEGISIVIPTYNRSGLLRYTLESILTQTIDRALLEVIVVDDGSTDNTDLLVESFSDRLLIKYYYQQDEGYRVASARNLGIENASSDIVLFIDSGMVMNSTCAALHFKRHYNSQYPLALIGYMFGLQLPQINDSDSLKILTSYPDVAINEFLTNKRYLDLRECVFALCNSDLSKLPAPWALFWTGNVSVRKTDIVRAGLFDTNFDKNWGLEDVDLGLRLFKNGLKFSLEREAAAIHIPHDSDHYQKGLQESKNKLYLHSKHKCVETERLLTSSTIQLNFSLKHTPTK